MGEQGAVGGDGGGREGGKEGWGGGRSGGGLVTTAAEPKTNQQHASISLHNNEIRKRYIYIIVSLSMAQHKHYTEKAQANNCFRESVSQDKNHWSASLYNMCVGCRDCHAEDSVRKDAK